MSRRLPIAFSLLVIVALAAACGGGGQALSLEEYFQRLDAVEQKAQDDTVIADEQLNTADASGSDEEKVRATDLAFQTFAEALDTYVSGLDGIKPPAEVEDEHKEAKDAAEEYAAVIDDLIASLQQATTGTQVDQTLQSTVEGEAFIAADQRFTDSCVALQTAADDNDIDVELDCGEA